MKKAIVCDLDGTLVATNTFTRFTLFLARRPYMTLPVMWTALRRKLRLISHSRAKQELLRLAADNLTADEYRAFAAGIIKRYLRRSVLDLAKSEKEEGKLVLLATAAPQVYADVIREITGMDGCIATPTGGEENRNEEKVRRVKEWLAANDATLEAVITDHHDDLPLMKYAAAAKSPIWLVRPSVDTLRRTRHLDPQVL